MVIGFYFWIISIVSYFSLLYSLSAAPADHSDVQSLSHHWYCIGIFHVLDAKFILFGRGHGLIDWSDWLRSPLRSKRRFSLFPRGAVGCWCSVVVLEASRYVCVCLYDWKEMKTGNPIDGAYSMVTERNYALCVWVCMSEVNRTDGCQTKWGRVEESSLNEGRWVPEER